MSFRTEGPETYIPFLVTPQIVRDLFTPPSLMQREDQTHNPSLSTVTALWIKDSVWFATNLHIRKACSKGGFSPPFLHSPPVCILHRIRRVATAKKGGCGSAVDWERKFFKGFIQKTTLPQTGRPSVTSPVPPITLPAQELLLQTLHKGLN